MPALFDLLKVGYSGRATKCSEVAWRWQYEDNLNGSGPGFDTWIIKNQGVILAQRPTMPIALKVGDVYSRANCLTDYLVHPDYRDRGLGTLMQRQVVEDVDTCVSLDASARSRTIFGKLGFTWMGEVCHFVRVCDPLPYLVARLGRWVNPLGPVVRLGWRWRERMRPKPPGDVRIESVEFFGKEIDDLWERVAPDYPVIARRDSATLNRRFVDAPIRSLILLAYRDQALSGYLVYRAYEVGGDRRGVICDILAAPDDSGSFDALILEAAARLARDGVKAIDAHAFHPIFQSRLKRHGFRLMPGVSFIVHTNLPEPARSLLIESQNWYITGLDSDLDPIFH